MNAKERKWGYSRNIEYAPGKIRDARRKEATIRPSPFYKIENREQARDSDFAHRGILPYDPEDLVSVKHADLVIKIASYMEQWKKLKRWHGKTKEIRVRIRDAARQYLEYK